MAEKLAKSLINMMGGLLSLSFGKQLIVFIISMLPILELRGGLIAASLLGLPPIESYLIAILGNIIPVPFILLLMNKMLKAMEKSRFKIFNKIHSFLHKKIMKNKDSIEKYGFWGLVLFVGIPLPGTGAWTGSIIAAFLEMDRKKAFFAILLGMLMASIIMMIISFGLIKSIV
ncbi:COG2426 family protein [Lachnoanaerobaculum umeaense]|uniref:Small multi-drug export protein n=1 Tax=Lachnoanaerobaculum umeaense TaxID=617123 RepID=A0A385PYZ8_9FIRM|nr:small multi-drug export protein [Lachnoanaerobaculum umeaense]AYA99222.1 small multi-drug export protein [Lachnoanaerobaculum umeaense]PZW93341.1 putative membrane protein [Lachnoanaerobaculum umeaense]